MQDVLALFETAKAILHVNLQGITHEDSLKSPSAGGNCLNWVVGHMTTAYDNLLKGHGQESGWDAETSAPYARGSEPLTPENAQPMDEVLAAFDRAHARVVALVSSLDDEKLAQPAPFSPRNKADETVGSLLQLFAFHQSYHTGQTGVLRRVAGHDGAVA